MINWQEKKKHLKEKEWHEQRHRSMRYSVWKERIQFIKLKMRSRRGGVGWEIEVVQSWRISLRSLDESSIGDFNWSNMIRFTLRKILFCRSKKEGLVTVMSTRETLMKSQG